MTLDLAPASRRPPVDPRFAVGAGIALLIAVVALLSLVWTPFGATALTPLAEPDAAHWIGVDAAGREGVSLLMSATLTTLLLAALATLVCLLLGIPAGAALALVSTVRSRPPLPVALLPSALAIGLVISGLSAPGYSTIVLGIVIPGTVVAALGTRETLGPLWRKDFVTAARLAGLSAVSAAQRHVLPHVLPRLVAFALELLASAILVEVSLSFAGLGVSAPAVSLGLMLHDAQQFILLRPLLVVAPGAVAVVLTLALLAAASGLRGQRP